MNIYADRGNLLLLERRCEWRGIGFELHGRRPRRRARPRRRRPLLHRRRPGPRPEAVRARPRRAQARRAARRRRPRRGDPRRVRRLPAARPLLPARRRDAARASGSWTSHTVRGDGPRLIGNVAIEVELDGRGRRGCSPGSRTTAAAPTWAPARSRSGGCCAGTATTGASGVEGVRRGQRDRHLPPRPAAAQERLVRRLADRHRAGPRPSRWRRSTTRSRTPLTPRPGGPPGVYHRQAAPRCRVRSGPTAARLAAVVVAARSPAWPAAAAGTSSTQDTPTPPPRRVSPA